MDGACSHSSLCLASLPCLHSFASHKTTSVHPTLHMTHSILFRLVQDVDSGTFTYPSIRYAGIVVVGWDHPLSSMDAILASFCFGLWSFACVHSTEKELSWTNDQSKENKQKHS